MSNNERGSAAILVDAIRETSSSMRDVAIDLRDMNNTVANNNRSLDELRAENRRQSELLLRIEGYLKGLDEDQEERKNSKTALVKFVESALKLPAVQFVLVAIAYWFAAKIGVLQYLGVRHAP